MAAVGVGEAPLLVGADGKKSLVRSSTGFRAREHGFVEAALVCEVAGEAAAPGPLIGQILTAIAEPDAEGRALAMLDLHHLAEAAAMRDYIAS